MTNAQLVDTLESLRSEKAVVSAEAEVLQQELGEKQHHLSRLNAAISALESLLPDGQTRSRGPETADASAKGTMVLADAAVYEGRRSEVPERLQKYLPVGGQRLRSKLMVFDLLQRIGQPVTRDQLRRSFFEYFGRENIEQFWLRPDSALNTAIDRARDEDLILQIEDPQGGPALFTTNFRESDTGLPAHYHGEGEDE